MITEIKATIDGVETVLFPVAVVAPAPVVEEPVKVDVTDAVGHDTEFVPEVIPEAPVEAPVEPTPTE